MSKKTISIICSIILAGIFAIAGINTYNAYTNPKDEQNVDSNIYLNEEVCFAKEVYINVVGINVEKNDDKYILNLKTNIEQRSIDGKKDKVKIEPKNFVLKSVNLKAKSQMSVFFESLFKATVSALLSGAIEGSINIIEETVSFVSEYTTEAITTAIDSKSKFKNTKTSTAFNSFYPRDIEGVTTLDLTFPINISTLKQTNNIVVLTIDQWNHVERRIFLITRPQ